MYVAHDSVEAVTRAVRDLAVGPRELALVLVPQNTSMEREPLLASLREVGCHLMGGMFPGVIHGGNLHTDGAVVLKLPILSEPQVLTGLDAGTGPIARPENVADGVSDDGQRRTVLTIFDGLSTGITRFVERLYARFGQSVRYFGGGAGVHDRHADGPLTFAREPMVFTREGWFIDAAVIAVVDWSSTLGICHGWQRVAGPFVATRTRGSHIFELDWEPALDIYRRVVEADSGRPIDRAAFFDVAQSYPFGISKVGCDDVVRLVGGVSADDALVCGVAVAENTTLHILRGRADTLLEAARTAAAASLADQPTPEQVLVWDCISRKLILEDRFDHEIGAIQDNVSALGRGAEAAGVLSLGELASDGNRVLEYFNKTVAIASFHSIPSSPRGAEGDR